METNIFSKEWKTLKMLNIWVNIKKCFLSYFLLNYVCVVKAIIKLPYGCILDINVMYIPTITENGNKHNINY